MTKEIKETKEIAIVPTDNAETLIKLAIEKGASVDTLEKLLTIRRELKAEFAKEQFDNAMADFQSECPVIKKSKNGGATNTGVVAYKYAPLEVIVSQVKDLIHKHGFSYAIQTETSKEMVKAICIVKHKAGHSESSNMEVPLGTKTQVMSNTQVVAAALTFAKRYAFCNGFGILTGDEDTNAPVVSDNPREACDKAITRLRATKSLDGLKAVFVSLPAKIQKDDEVVAVKNEMKKSIK